MGVIPLGLSDHDIIFSTRKTWPKSYKHNENTCPVNEILCWENFEEALIN